jgi:hypothetical protein
MELGSPFDALHGAIAAAIHRDLPDIVYQDRDWEAWKKMSESDKKQAMRDSKLGPTIAKTRRPDERDIEVIMFPQTWGSTALGYGGMGGAAMTPAYTVVVETNNHTCVYFGPGGQLAYMIEHRTQSQAGCDALEKDLRSRMLADVMGSEKYK